MVVKMTNKDCYIRILRLDYNGAFATFCSMFDMKKELCVGFWMVAG